jgi:Flp pilus assembly pilin Flp
MTDYLNKLSIRLSALWRREDGQTMAEYGIILAVVGVVAAVAFIALGSDITNALTDTSNAIKGIVPAGK